MNQAALEQSIVNHARLKTEIDSLIENTEFFTDPAGGTICHLILMSGFKVHGRSACSDAEDGQALAHTDALNTLWQLEVYAQSDRLFRLKPAGEA